MERATDNESVGWRGDLNAWEMYSPTGPGARRPSPLFEKKSRCNKTLTVIDHLL